MRRTEDHPASRLPPPASTVNRPRGKASAVLAVCLALALCLTAPNAPSAPTNAPPAGWPASEAPAGAARGAAPDAPRRAAPETPRPLQLRIGEAVLLALTNNRALAVQRLEPAIRRTFEDQERALFDPVLAGDLFTERQHSRVTTATTEKADVTTTSSGGTLGISERLPTGTRVGAEVATARDSTEGAAATHATKAVFSVTQALLQGRPVAVNLVPLRQTRLDTAASEYEFRGLLEALVADVETAYWECSLAGRRVEIYEDALRLADQQLKEIEHRIRVGDLPETELASAQAETALRREALINARSALALARLRLLRLADPGALGTRRRELALTTTPLTPETALDSLDSHVAAALRWRPDLNQARLGVQRGDLELVRTKNGLLPRMDIFIALGKTGYAASFQDSLREIDTRDPDISARIELEFPLANRAARSRHQRALLSREQAAKALDNVADLARVDVESAYIEVERTREQISATATTRRFQVEKLRAETAKFRVGKSTSLLLAQAQQDLVASQVSEVEALVRHLQALVALFRLEGSLLERRGLSVPAAGIDEVGR